MVEPTIPVPDPEPNSNWEPSPARCQCGEIIDAAPNGKGWCQFHGVVDAVYSTSFQETEMTDEEEKS